MGTARKGGDVISVDEERDGVSLTNLGEPLFSGAGVTKRDLVDYLDAVRGQLIPELSGRPLSVVRVLRGQEPFMQKNVPKYTPPWVRTIRLWAESSRREVSYALCDDRRTLLWFANQRAVEYHPTLSEAGLPDRPDYLVLDIDPPPAGSSGPRSSLPSWSARRSPAAAWRARSRPAGRRACTCSCRSPRPRPRTPRRPPARWRPGRSGSTRPSPPPRSSGRTGTARSSSTRPGPAGPPWWRPTARGSGQGCPCPSRCPGRSWTG